MAETKSITGIVSNIDDTGEYNGKKKWRVYIEVPGRPGAFPVDMMDNSANKTPGQCPAIVGSEFTASYTDKEWTNNSGELITFHNYRWPGGGGYGGGSKTWVPKKPSVDMSISKDIGGTVFAVTATVPLDEAESKAGAVNTIFNALYLARKKAPEATSPLPAPPTPPAQQGQTGFVDEVPF